MDKIAEAAFHSPITELELPSSVHNLLETNGYENVGDLILQMNADEKQVLAIRGIGPKILEQIEVAIKQYEAPKDFVKTETPTYSPPVPSLADYFRPPQGNMESTNEEKPDQEDPADASPSYNPPVPSLADYFDPDSVITSVNPMKSNAIAVANKQKPPKKKAKKKKQVTKKKEGSKDKKAKKKESKKQKSKKKVSKPTVKKKKVKRKSKNKKKR